MPAPQLLLPMACIPIPDASCRQLEFVSSSLFFVALGSLSPHSVCVFPPVCPFHLLLNGLSHCFLPSSSGKSRLVNDKFTVLHFAGEVQYYVEGFLEKNNDTLYTDLEVTPLLLPFPCLCVPPLNSQLFRFLYFTSHPSPSPPPSPHTHTLAVADAQQHLQLHA